MEESSLKEKTAKGLFWGGFSNGMQQLLNLFFGIFLARLLSPSDYGLVGMLTIFTLIAGSLQESGFISAITNRRNVTSNDYNAVFWFSILVSVSVYVLLFFCAPYSPLLRRTETHSSFAIYFPLLCLVEYGNGP